MSNLLDNYIISDYCRIVNAFSNNNRKICKSDKFEVIFLYNSDKTALAIKRIAKEKGIAIGKMLSECGLNKDTLNTMTSRGSWIQSNSLAKIADVLDCSVDYLLERTGNPEAHKNGTNVSVGNVSGNSGAIGVGNTVTNTAMPLDEQTLEMLNTYQKLNPLNKAKLLVYADELEKIKGEKTFFHVSSHSSEGMYLIKESKPFQELCDLICEADTSSLDKCKDLLKEINQKNNYPDNEKRRDDKWLCEAIFEYVRKTEYPDNPSRVWGVFVVDTPEKAEEFIIKSNRKKESKIFEIVQPVENVFEYDMSFFDFAHVPIVQKGLNMSTFENACERAKSYWRHARYDKEAFIEYIIDGTNPIHIGGLYKG